MKAKLKSLTLAHAQDRNEEIIDFLTRDKDGRDPLAMAAESWKWRYVDSPAGEGIISIVVDEADNERIVGHSALAFFNCTCGGTDILVSYVGGIFISSDYRKGGCYAMLRKTEDEAARSRGLSMLIGLPSKLAIPGFLLSGFYMQQQFELAFRAITFMKKGFLTNPLSFIKHAVLYAFACFLSKQHKKHQDLDVKQLHCFGGETDILWKRVSKNYLGIIKDSRYLNWRYGQRPNTSFIALMALKKNNPRALCIIEWHNDQPRNGWVAELIARYDDEDDAMVILNEAEKQASKMGVEKLGVLVDGVSITGAVSNKRGYSRYHVKPFMVRTLDKNSGNQRSIPWSYSMGDFMTGMRMI